MQDINDALYLRDRPESFVKTADVHLKLDSGDTLPAHSMILSLHSDVLSDMLALNKPGDSHFQVLPFPDCTLEDATSLLLCMYARRGAAKFSLKGAESVTVLAHKFGMNSILEDFDNFLADKAASDGSSSLWV